MDVYGIGSITSFGERPNEYDEVTNYFKAHFAQVHRRNNEAKRVLYIHLTSVVVSHNDAFRLHAR